MTMAARGIPKLIEECGELQQVLGKRLAYYTTDEHPDGSNLRRRMTEEMGDVLAAIEFVAEQEGLDYSALEGRVIRKLATFHMWDARADNNAEGVDAP